MAGVERLMDERLEEALRPLGGNAALKDDPPGGSVEHRVPACGEVSDGNLTRPARGARVGGLPEVDAAARELGHEAMPYLVDRPRDAIWSPPFLDRLEPLS
jgi:hypothetical protein